MHGRPAIFDGEIVCLDNQGRSLFAPLLNRQACPYFYAFDLLHLDSDDRRRRPLMERKQELAQLIARTATQIRMPRKQAGRLNQRVGAIRPKDNDEHQR